MHTSRHGWAGILAIVLELSALSIGFVADTAYSRDPGPLYFVFILTVFFTALSTSYFAHGYTILGNKLNSLPLTASAITLVWSNGVNAFLLFLVVMSLVFRHQLIIAPDWMDAILTLFLAFSLFSFGVLVICSGTMRDYIGHLATVVGFCAIAAAPFYLIGSLAYIANLPFLVFGGVLLIKAASS